MCFFYSKSRQNTFYIELSFAKFNKVLFKCLSSQQTVDLVRKLHKLNLGTFCFLKEIKI